MSGELRVPMQYSNGRHPPMSEELSPLSYVSTIRGRPALERPRRGPSRAGRGLTGKGKTNPKADLFETMKKIPEER